MIEAAPGAVVQVNRETVAQAALQPNDQITIGQTRLRYRGPGVAAPVAVPIAAPPPAGQLAQPPMHAQQPGGPAISPTVREQPAPGPASLYLVDAADRRYPLTGDTITIGSAPGNVMVIQAPGVASFHAEVRREGQHLVIYDKGADILVNDRPIQGRNMIRAGFTVRLGSTEFTVSP